MTLSAGQPSDSLKEIEKAAQSSASAYGYVQSSPYLWMAAVR